LLGKLNARGFVRHAGQRVVVTMRGWKPARAHLARAN